MNAVQMYVAENRSTPEISAALGVSISTVRRQLLAAGVALRTAKQASQIYAPKISAKLTGRSRDISPEWRAKINASKRLAAIGSKGTRINSRGYVEICSRQSPDYGRLEHAVVMERHIGRRLAAGEVVHHIDENKQNNAIENLRLMTNAAHVSLHRKQAKSKGKK